MRAADIRHLGTMRAQAASAGRGDTRDDAGRFQPAVSGDGGALYGRNSHGWMASFQRARGTEPDAGPVPGGRQHPSRSGRADGGAVGPGGGSQPGRGPDFSRIVPPNGYAWWYVDALSDDGQDGITIIAFIGSVFSPYYAFARRRAMADPLNHCAINVALYRRGRKHWAMTERPRNAVSRTVSSLVVGPSDLSWDGHALTIHLDEIAVPVPARLRGTVRVVPTAVTQRSVLLNEEGNHRWWPIAPCARVQVAMTAPSLRWQGDGYFDMNCGDAPLEQGFVDWQWSRGALRDGTAILYQARRRGGSRFDLALKFDPQGKIIAFRAPAALRSEG